MKKTIAYSTIAALSAAALIPATTVTTEAAENNLPGGFYFTNPEATGVFYSFDDWAELDGNTKLALLNEYGRSNVKIYLDSTNQIATLGDLEESGTNFAQGSTVYEEGNLSGSYKDAVTGDVINPAPEVELTITSVSAVDATTISVVFEGVEEAVEITLDTELVDGENEVTFTYNEQEFTVTVNYEAPATELVVESVSAINATVDVSSEEKQYVSFTVNDKAVTIDDLKDAGYTVKFLANKTGVLNATTGEITAAAGTEFKFQVEISKEGTETVTSDPATVKAENASLVLTEVTKIVPVVGTQEKSSNTVKAGEAVEFNVYGTYKNDTSKEVKLKEADLAKLKLTSSKPTTLYIGSDNKATAITAGEATVTAKVGELTATQAITISADEIKLATLTADSSTVTVAKNGETAKIKVSGTDTYGDAFILANADGQKVVASFVPAEGTTAAASSSVSYKDGVATVEVTGTAKGTGTLTLTVGEKEVEVSVTVLEAGEATKYEIAGDSEVDLADEATFEYTLQGYDNQELETGEAVTLPTEGDVYYKVKSSDKKVADVKINSNKVVLTPEKAGEVTVTLEKYEGTLTTPTATYTKEITIEDSRAKLTGATLVKEADLPEFTASEAIETELTAELSEVIEKLSFLPSTTAYKLVQGKNDTVINIVDTNGDVTNNVLGTIEVKAVGSTDVDAEIAPNGDTDATITLNVDQTAATDKTGAVIVNVKDADGNIVADVALDINVVGATTLLENYLASDSTDLFKLTHDVDLDGLTLGANKDIDVAGFTVNIKGALVVNGHTLDVTNSTGDRGTVMFNDAYTISGATDGQTIIDNTDDKVSFEVEGEGATSYTALQALGYDWNTNKYEYNVPVED